MLVSAAKPACRKSFAAEAASDHVSRRPVRGASDLGRREAGADPRADAAGARDELADRLLHAAVLDRLLVLAVVGLALDERLADEARHLVVGDRARGLEGRRREQREVERAELLRAGVRARRDAADARRGRRRSVPTIVA